MNRLGGGRQVVVGLGFYSQEQVGDELIYMYVSEAYVGKTRSLLLIDVDAQEERPTEKRLSYRGAQLEE